jgi:hypothetical protein
VGKWLNIGRDVAELLGSLLFHGYLAHIWGLQIFICQHQNLQTMVYVFFQLYIRNWDQ